VFLLGGLGLILFLFGKFDFLGWRGESGAAHVHQSPLIRSGPSRRANGRRASYFVVVVLLLLGQVLVAGAMAHYRVESGAFYGIDLARYFPFNLLRTWHLQLAIFWIATAWVAGGLFLAPMVGGAEPRASVWE